ncbi:hypothetical protein EDM59_12510, partial [Brevibacillus nitrificans]
HLVQSWQIINDRLINAFAVQFSKSILSSGLNRGISYYQIKRNKSTLFSIPLNLFCRIKLLADRTLI